MKKQILAVAVGALLAQAPVQAQAMSLSKTGTGAGVGAAVGAVLGGPLGLVVGAMSGSLIGAHEAQRDQVASLEARLQDSEAAPLAGAYTEPEVSEQGALLMGDSVGTGAGGLPLTVASAAATAVATGGALAGESVVLSIGFRTASADIEPHFLEQLTALQELLVGFPDLHVRLAGHADPRGGPVYNQDLSERRARTVALFLEHGGVDPERIHVAGHGEAQPISAGDDREAYPFERCVVIRLARHHTTP